MKMKRHDGTNPLLDETCQWRVLRHIDFKQAAPGKVAQLDAVAVDSMGMYNSPEA